MSLFSGDALWPNVNASHFGPVVSCYWDAAANGFRPYTSSQVAFGSTGISLTEAGNTFNVPSNFVVSGSPTGLVYNGTALLANSNRRALFVQNLGINPLYVKFGTAGANDNSMNMVLKPGTVSGIGDGGQFYDDQGIVTGLVSVSGIASNYLIWQA